MRNSLRSSTALPLPQPVRDIPLQRWVDTMRALYPPDDGMFATLANESPEMAREIAVGWVSVNPGWFRT